MHAQQWKNVSPKEVAYGEGFYDYADGTDYSAVTHPDSAFARLEREFPVRREEMAADAFADWEKHKEFLLDFMQMMRARSPLAMQQREGEARNLRGATVTGVSPDGRTLTVDSLELRPLPEHFIRNFTISKMLQEVKAGASWMSEFDWCLRYTNEENYSFCTTDQAFFAEGTLKHAPVTIDLVRHPDTLLFFPLSWQACLFGSSLRFDTAYDRADPRDIQTLRAKQKRYANRFVMSPVTF